MAGGGKTATSTSQVKIPPEVLARYNAVNAQAQQVAQQPFHPYSLDPNAFVAPLTPTQQMGIYNTNVAAGTAQPYYQQAGEALQAGLAGAAPMAYAGAMPVMPGQLGAQQIGQYMSPFLGSVVGTTMAAQAQQNAQQRAAMQGQAIQQGAFGGDRAGIAQANLAYQQNLANSQTLANLMNQGYGQALTTAQQQQQLGLSAEQANRAALQQQAQNLYGMYGGYGQALAGLGTGAQQAALQGAQAQLAAGQAQQQTGQAGLAALYNQFMQQQSYPFQVAQFLANIAMGTGALSGSTTTTTQPAPFFSDRRLKHDVHKIGKTNDGLPIYSFKYNGDDRTQIGLMAQDVEEKHPEAVGLAGGYKTVDYEKATKDSHKAYGGGLSSMGGAVAPEHAGLGFERGGYLGGGLVSRQDLQAILARQQEQFPGYAQMGRDLRGLPGGGKSHVPGGGVHVPQLVTAKAPSMQQQSALQQATGAIGDIEKVWGAGEKGLGAIEKASDWVRGQTGLSASNPQNQTETSFPTPPSFVPPPEDPNNPLRRYSGGLVRARADGGEIFDEKDTEKDIPKDSQIDFPESTSPDKASYGKIFSGKLDIPDESGQSKGLSPAQTPAFQSPNFLKDTIQPLASVVAMIPSDRRLKENIEHVGKTFDGQNIYKYNYKGDPRTHIGLIAQEVQRHHPDAVGSSHGYKTVDYDAATEAAAARGHFYSGGLVPRHGYATDGEVEPVPEPDLFSVMDRFEGRGLTPSPGVRGAGAAGFGQVIPSTYAGWAGKYRSENPWMPATHEEYSRAPEDVQRRVYSEVVVPREYRPALEGAGLGVTPLNVAAVNFLGPAGGTSFLKAAQENPNAPASAVVSPAAVANNKNVFFDKSTGQERTVGEVLNYISGQRGAPAERPAGLAAARAEAPARQDAGLAPLQANISMTQEQPSAQQVARHIQGLRGEPDWMQRNQDWLVPLGKGILGMVTSPSRYLGSAVLAGIGSGLQGWQETQNAMQKRALEIAQSTAQLAPSMPGMVPTVDQYGRILATTPGKIYRRSREMLEGQQPTGAAPSGGPSAPAAPGAPSAPPTPAAPSPMAPAAPSAPQAPKAPSPIQVSTEGGGYQVNFMPNPNNPITKMIQARPDEGVNLNDPQDVLEFTRRMSFDPVIGKDFEVQNKDANARIRGAQTSSPTTRDKLNETANAYLEVARQNPSVVGIGPRSEDRAAVARTFQFINELAPEWVKSVPGYKTLQEKMASGEAVDATQAQQVLQKISQLSGTMLASQYGERAAAVQQAIAGVLPSLNLGPKATAEILSDMYIQNQREADFAKYAEAYYRQYGTYYGAQDSFTSTMSGQYLKDRNAIRDALMGVTEDNKPRTAPFLLWRQTPEGGSAKLDRRYQGYTGPGISRYFAGG